MSRRVAWRMVSGLVADFFSKRGGANRKLAAITVTLEKQRRVADGHGTARPWRPADRARERVWWSFFGFVLLLTPKKTISARARGACAARLFCPPSIHAHTTQLCAGTPGSRGRCSLFLPFRAHPSTMFPPSPHARQASPSHTSSLLRRTSAGSETSGSSLTERRGGSLTERMRVASRRRSWTGECVWPFFESGRPGVCDEGSHAAARRGLGVRPRRLRARGAGGSTRNRRAGHLSLHAFPPPPPPHHHHQA